MPWSLSGSLITNSMRAWLVGAIESFTAVASCSITELGFVRVLAQALAYGFTVAHARTLLLRLKEARISGLAFIADTHDVSHLPGWVKVPKQITDGHLTRLASARGAILATLDENIPGSYRFRNDKVAAHASRKEFKRASPMPEEHLHNYAIHHFGDKWCIITSMSRTNIDIDEDLIRKARKLTHLKTKRQIVDRALDLLVRSESRKGILRYYGAGIWKGDLKASRRNRD